jgi:hypothetical protein
MRVAFLDKLSTKGVPSGYFFLGLYPRCLAASSSRFWNPDFFLAGFFLLISILALSLSSFIA